MRRRLICAALLATVGSISACSSSSSGGKTPPASPEPPRIVPTSAGTLSGTGPTSDGRIWVLGGSRRVKTLTNIRLSDGKVLTVASVSPTATAVAQSVTGQFAVGTGTPTTGAVDFRNGNTGAVLATTPLPKPVISVAAGDDGTTFYVLNGTNGVDNVAIVDSQNDQVQQTVPAPSDAVAVVATPDQSSVYVLTKSGGINEISVASGRVEADFGVDMTGIGLAMAPSGQTLFVLGGPSSANAIAQVDLDKDSQTGVVPAAGHSVAVAAGVDDTHVLDYVGTPRVGNVQIIQLSSE